MPPTDHAALQAQVDTAEAACIIRAGGVIAYPTEAVYGLGCDPKQLASVQRILEIKTRAEDKGLILVASCIEQFKTWIKPLDQTSRSQLGATWPGHTTWVVPARDDCPALLCGGRDTVAIRVTAHPEVRALCDAVGHAVVSTSANRSGDPAIRDIADLASLPNIDGILDGQLGGESAPSRIYRLSDGARLR